MTDFHVAVDYQRKGRDDKVVAVQFRIRRVLDHQELDKRTLSLFPDLVDRPLAIKILKEAGLSAKDASKIRQTEG